MGNDYYRCPIGYSLYIGASMDDLIECYDEIVSFQEMLKDLSQWELLLLLAHCQFLELLELFK